jgi:unsaturated rhamnogalacturonyl hydrolase
MNVYRSLMAGLLPCQAESGLWRQLIDDPAAWEETSGTGMVAFALIMGIKKDWLDKNIYGQAALLWAANALLLGSGREPPS